jgi:nucleotide-binding universal stress UspA family protein
MASNDTHAATPDPATGPVLFAYDGCDSAKLAIEQAGRQLAPGRDALVVCVWQTGDVGFVPTGEQHFKASAANEVKQAAEEVAEQGAALAKRAGFNAQSVTIEAAPTWKGIVEIADQRGASLIVFGSHRRTGLVGHLLGSVTDAVVAHTAIAVLIVHQQS